jgi:phosphate transport system substrate-binding protein
MGDFGFFPVVAAGNFAVIALTIGITLRVSKKKITYDRRVVWYVLGFLLLSGIAAFQHYDRSIKIIAYEDSRAESIQDEVDLYNYRPFREENLLKRLPETAHISFNENYPKLDGATAAYPVYGAMAQELYKGLDEDTVDHYVTCSKTDEAYERLIRGEIDIFFGAQPSPQQIEAAKEKGVEFVLTPIAREAFVFFVNKENPVNNLTLGQIQDIYQKKVTNWQRVGGKDERILPFQRPKNSGSQTIMLAMVMRDKTLPAPLWEEYSMGMGGMISQVAEYRNYSSSIGYSFRYFATGMKPNNHIKLLAVDGIEPTLENIRNGTYPFTIDVYAVTAGSSNENTAKLMDWIVSKQGQDFIEFCGYVKNRKQEELIGS